MSKGGFFLQGIVALPCASQSTDTLAKHTYTAINTTSNPNPNPSSLIQEYEGKNSTMKPNTTFSVLSADYLKNTLGNANIQDKTHTCTHTHAYTHTHRNLPGHIVYRQNNSLFQRIRCNNPCSETLVGGFKGFNWGLRCKVLFLVSLWRQRNKLCIFFKSA